MLTDSELAWLKRRQFFNGFYTTSGCLTCSLNETLCDKTDCLLHPDLEDALEFSERVAAKLATYATMMVGSDIAAPCLECPCQKAGVCYHGTNKSCQWSFLTTARLQVEEEMNAEMDK